MTVWNRGTRILPQKGQALIEFPIVLLLVFLPLVLAVMEFGRAFYAWNTISEATRRGARLAVVTGFEGETYNATAINYVKRWAIFANGSSNSPVLSNLTTSDVTVVYLDNNYVSTTTYENVRYVRVSIDYKFQPVVSSLLNLPLSIPLPTCATTLPRESLGVVPSP
jgi:Flp pilus assembly protein TadG